MDDERRQESARGGLHDEEVRLHQAAELRRVVRDVIG
jgi:hypothetical protein